MSTANTSRQYPLVALVDLGIDNIGAGNEVTVAVRPGTLVTAVRATIGTAFNGTTNTITVGDGTTTFLSTVDAKAAANTVHAATVGKFYPSGGTLTISMAQTGAATAGRALALVEYVILNRDNEYQA